MHSKKFDELLPGDINYDDLKTLRSGDILEVITILLKGTKITADDAKALVVSKPVQSFLNSKEFNEKLLGDLTYDTLVKAAKSDEMKILVSVANGNSFSIDDVKTILKSEIWVKYFKSSHVRSMTQGTNNDMDLLDFIQFRYSEEFKILTLLVKGEKFSIEDAKSLVNSKAGPKLSRLKTIQGEVTYAYYSRQDQNLHGRRDDKQNH